MTSVKNLVSPLRRSRPWAAKWSQRCPRCLVCADVSNCWYRFKSKNDRILWKGGVIWCDIAIPSSNSKDSMGLWVPSNATIWTCKWNYWILLSPSNDTWNWSFPGCLDSTCEVSNFVISMLNSKIAGLFWGRNPSADCNISRWNRAEPSADGGRSAFQVHLSNSRDSSSVALEVLSFPQNIFRRPTIMKRHRD